MGFIPTLHKTCQEAETHSEWHLCSADCGSDLTLRAGGTNAGLCPPQGSTLGPGLLLLLQVRPH